MKPALMDEIERRLKDTLDLVMGWLRYAEGKNGAAIALTGAAVVAVVTAVSDDVVKQDWLIVILVIATALFGASLLVALATFLPILNENKAINRRAGKPATADNLLYFEHIRKYTGQLYLKEVRERYYPDVAIADKDLKRLTDIANQTVAISAITSRKMLLFKVGAWMIFGAVIFLMVAALGSLICPLQ